VCSRNTELDPVLIARPEHGPFEREWIEAAEQAQSEERRWKQRKQAVVTEVLGAHRGWTRRDQARRRRERWHCDKQNRCSMITVVTAKTQHDAPAPQGE
jgi:hypothetical protein